MKKCLAFLLLALSGALQAQSGELWVSGGGSILAGKNFGSPSDGGPQDDVRLGDGFRAGIRFAFNSSGRFGHELQYAYNRTTLSDATGVVLGDPGSAEWPSIREATISCTISMPPGKNRRYGPS